MKISRVISSRSARGPGRTRKRSLAATLCVLSVVAAACGDDDDSSVVAATTTTTAAAAPAGPGTTAPAAPASPDPATTNSEPPEEPEELVELRIGTAAAASLIPVWVAFEQGYFLDHGIDVRMEVFNTGGEITQAIAAGHLDAGVANLSNAVPIAVAGGTPLRAVVIPDANPFAIYNAGRFGILARTDSGVTASNPETLRGKRVGLQVGGTPDIFFQNYLASVGLTADDVNIQSIPVTELSVALEQGIVDVGVTWDPFVLRLMNTMGDDITLIQQGGPFASDLSAWIATDELIDGRPEVAKAMLRAIIEAVLFLNDDPRAGAEIAMKYIDGMTLEEAEYSMASRVYDPRPSVCTIEEIRRSQEDLIAAKKLEVDKPFAAEELFALDLLEDVLAEYDDELSQFKELPKAVEDCDGF